MNRKCNTCFLFSYPEPQRGQYTTSIYTTPEQDDTAEKTTNNNYVRVHRQRPVWFGHTQAGFGYLDRAEGTRYEAAHKNNEIISDVIKDERIEKGKKNATKQFPYGKVSNPPPKGIN